MNKQAVNTFKEGLVMDLNPLANDNKSLTNALNATFITQNGNELMLQNDMGNGRINRVRLDDGYIPIGMKEYGGIIYVASYNPKNGKGQIGSFPYPKLEWENSDFQYNEITLNALYGNEIIKAKPQNEQSCILNFYEILDDSIKIPLLIDNSTGEQVKIHSGDSFSIQFYDDSTINFLNSPTVNVKLIVKTSSNYYTVSDNKTDIINGKTFIYGGSYSGVVYLQIDLIVYNNFEVDYILNENGATVYPRSFNTQLGYSSKAVVLNHPEQKLDEESNTSNVNCNLEQFKDNINIQGSGTYYVYPITQDGGYLANLRRKINIPENLQCESRVAQFKYLVEDTAIKIISEYQTVEDSHTEFESITYKYRFYPIKSIKDSINSKNDLQNLYKTNNYTLEVLKSGYTTKSGIRYLETDLPENDIYLLVVSCQKYQENEEILFTRFIYGTTRYNDLYDTQDDFNLIQKEDIKIDYTLDSNVFQPKLYNISNYHLIDNNWTQVQDLVKYSEEPFSDNEKLPKEFRSEVSVILKKTEEPFIECSPEENYKFIFDKESFQIPTNNLQVTIKDFSDNPQKSSNNVLETGNPGNIVKDPIIQDQNLIFYRYISSKSDDGIIQQDRVLKTLAPVFDPNNQSDELLTWEYDNTSISSVICAKKFLTTSCNRLLNPLLAGSIIEPTNPRIGSNYSYLYQEESLTEGSVRLSNLQSALLNHSEESKGVTTPCIFDIYSGGASSEKEEATDYHEAAQKASLRIQRNMNRNEYAGIVSNDTTGHDEIHEYDNWMIATCLNTKGKPMPINLAGMCYSKVFDSGKYIGDYVNNSGEVCQVTDNNINNYPKISKVGMSLFAYINVAKKLQFLLSQIFTLQNLQKNIYLIGPSINTLNYNIQDQSYIDYTCNIDYCFTTEIDLILNNLQTTLNSLGYCETTQAKNYIGSIKSSTLNSVYNYGHLVNLASQLFGNILLQYENAYDNEELIDESKGYSDEEIYYLDPEKVVNSRPSYGEDSSDYIWPSLGIKFNSQYHCFTYDLNKLDTQKYVSKSTSTTTYEYLFDWTGCIWRLKPIASSFITTFKAQRSYSNSISGLNNNFIVLNKTSVTIPTKWTEGKPDSKGPGIVFVDFGLRGLCKGSGVNDPVEDQLIEIERLKTRLSTIITNQEYEELKNNGYYSE